MPELHEVTVSYSVGVKANVAKYENADASLSRTERWSVENLDEANALWTERYVSIHKELGDLIEAEYFELHGVDPPEGK